MDNGTEEKMISCPYNPTHVIRESRFPIHLGKCRRNYSQADKAVCPFNITHVVNKLDLDSHVRTCNDRRDFEVLKTEIQKKSEIRLKPIECSENWDDDPHVKSYNPNTYTDNAPVLRSLKGGSLKQKKDFRANERLRILSLNKQK